jgi:hypothetical protein
MRILIGIFVCMFVYGVYVSHLGPAFIALGMVAFLIYGEKQLNKRDAEFYASPAGAKQIAKTAELLDRHMCECMSSRV